MKKNLTERDANRTSVLFAFLIGNAYLCHYIGQTFETGGMVPSLILLGVIMVIFYKTVVKVRFTAQPMAFVIFVVCLYVFTRQKLHTSLFGREIAFYFCAVSFLAMFKCNTEKMLRYLSVGGLLLILPLYNDIFVEMISSRFNNNVAMGLSYALFPVLLAPLFHFVYYRKEKPSVLMYIVYVISFILLAMLCFKGTRGVVLSFVVAVCLIYVKGVRGEKRGLKAGRAFLVSTLAIVVIMNFYSIVSYMKELFDSMNIDAYFLEKIIQLQETGNISNGRSGLFEYTIEEFLKLPVFGHGICTMLYNTKFTQSYAHNFLFQLLYDGGVVLTIPVLMALAGTVYYIFAGEDKNESIFALFLFCVTIPRACFTGDIWKNTCFWLLVMHSMRFYKIKKKIGGKKGAEQAAVPEKNPEEKGAEAL